MNLIQIRNTGLCFKIFAASLDISYFSCVELDFVIICWCIFCVEFSESQLRCRMENMIGKCEKNIFENWNEVWFIFLNVFVRMCFICVRQNPPTAVFLLRIQEVFSRIPDTTISIPDIGSRIQVDNIPHSDPHQRIYVVLPKKLNVHPPDPGSGFYPSQIRNPDPRSGGQKSTGSRIRIHNC